MRHFQLEKIIGLLLLLTLLIFSFFYKLSLEPVYVWDEARRANDSLQMLLRGQWIIDFYDDNPQTRGTKSPLLLWLQVYSMKAFGISLWAIRFPNALCSVLIGIVIWYFANRYFKSNWLGVLAGCVFASSLAWVLNHAGRTADSDAFLVLFSLLYCLCFFIYCIHLQSKWLIWFWLFFTLAVLIKGIAGLFFAPGLFIFLLATKRLKTFLTNPLLYIGLAFFIFLIAGSYAFREWNEPGFLQAVYNNELGGRYLQELEHNGRPLFFYVKNLFWRYPFWVFLIIPAYIFGFFSRHRKVQGFTFFSAVLSASYLAIISLSKTKLYWYDLPLFPFFALQIALLLYYGRLFIHENFLKNKAPIIAYAASTAIFILIFFIPVRHVFRHINVVNSHLEDREQAWFLQEAIKEKKDLNNYIFLFEDYDRHISYYIQLLQLQNSNAKLINNPLEVTPGSFVVVSEDSTKQKIINSFSVVQKDEKFGCTVYFIKKKK